MQEQIFQKFIDNLPEYGWSKANLEHMEINPHEIALAFPDGLQDLAEYFVKIGDDAAILRSQQEDFAGLKIHQRIEELIMARLQSVRDMRYAVRKLLIFMASPHNQPFALKRSFATADLCWRLAGDASTDWNFYSKRMIFSAVYLATIHYFLEDKSEDLSDSREFLQHRLKDVLKIGKLKNKFGGLFARKGE